MNATSIPEGTTAVLVLDDGTTFFGAGIGVEKTIVAEICFNTSMWGYQEIITDPSYAGQAVAFTFPHIGNTGMNADDMESADPAIRGIILRAPVTSPSNWRSTTCLKTWMCDHDLVGITGVDTRTLTLKIRNDGAPNGIICHRRDGGFDRRSLYDEVKQWQGIKSIDLVGQVTCKKPFRWSQPLFSFNKGPTITADEKNQKHVVAIDYGVKQNSLRCLVSCGCRVTVVPATASAREILNYNPDGVFLSNGPGDPMVTARYASPIIRDLIESKKPLFGVCLGHQLLAVSLGAKTKKMHFGHHGANHPIRNVATDAIAITSQNHGFVVIKDSLPKDVIPSHYNLFDGTLAGIKVRGKPIFSVQYHPEASPGPQDSLDLFKEFAALL